MCHSHRQILAIMDQLHVCHASQYLTYIYLGHHFLFIKILSIGLRGEAHSTWARFVSHVDLSFDSRVLTYRLKGNMSVACSYCPVQMLDLPG